MATSKNQEKKGKPKFSRPTTALKHKKVLDNFTENGGNIQKAIKDAGYSQEVVENPQKILNSRTWQELMDAEFPDDSISERHNQLLTASRFEKQEFPPGAKLTANKIPGSEELSDEEIREMFAEAQCRVHRILHGTDKRIVYFSSPDNLARDKALDKVYKIKGRYTDESTPRSPHGNTYNFIFSAPVQEKIKVIEGELKELLKKPNDKKN